MCPHWLPFADSDLSPHALEMEAFADYVNDQLTGRTSAESEHPGLAVFQAGYESAQTDQPVNLRDRFGDLRTAGRLETDSR